MDPRNVSFAAGLLLTSCLLACDRPASKLDPTPLFQKELDALWKEFGFPGATAAYVLSDGTAGSVATGWSDVESGTPMQPSSRMLAGSVGKTFVSATALALAQEGRLDLDGRIASWFADESWFSRLPNHDSITLRHLLTHRAGLPNHVDDPAFAATFADWATPQVSFAARSLIEYALDQPPLFAAGQGWSYSDTGYILAGLIIEKAAGRSYYEEVDQRFLGPLGLDSTSPSDRVDLPGLAAGYLESDNPFGLSVKTLGDNGRMVWNPVVEWTGGGLVSNSLDLARWAKALLEGRAMETPYLDELLRATPTGGQEQGMSFGAGIAMRDTGTLGPWYSHGGWIPGYSSSMRYYPELRVAIAFQINTDIGIVDDSTTLYEDMATRLEQVIAAVTSE